MNFKKERRSVRKRSPKHLTIKKDGVLMDVELTGTFLLS